MSRSLVQAWDPMVFTGGGNKNSNILTIQRNFTDTGIVHVQLVGTISLTSGDFFILGREGENETGWFTMYKDAPMTSYVADQILTDIPLASEMRITITSLANGSYPLTVNAWIQGN